MSQGLRTRVAIGSATPLKWQTPRTVQAAFGPYARLSAQKSGPVIRDRTVVIAAVVLAAVAVVIVNLT